MNTNLKLRLGLLVLALAAFPALVVRLNRVPPIDRASAVKILAMMDREIEAKYGKQDAWKFAQFNARPSSKRSLYDDERVKRLMAFSPVASTPSLDADIDAAAQDYAAPLAEWDALTAQGLALRSFSAALTEAPELEWRAGVIPLAQGICKRLQAIHLARARQAARRGEWEAALAELSRAAHVADPFRLSLGLPLWAAAEARVTAYRAYYSLLSLDPPERFERAALHELLALGETDPGVGPFASAVRYRALTDWAIGAGIVDPGEAAPFALRNVLNAALQGRAVPACGMIHPAALVNWARRDAEARAWRRWDQQPMPYRWTDTPSEVKWLREATTAWPMLGVEPILPPERIAGLDPWTCGLLIPPRDYPPELDWQEFLLDGFRPLILVTYAARVYRRDHGDWPAKIEDLAPAYLPEIPLRARRGAWPLNLRMGWQRTSPGIRALLWRWQLPEGGPGQWDFSRVRETQAAPPPTLDFSSEPTTDAPTCLAVAEELHAHPRLAQNPQAWIGERQSAKEIAWRELTPDEALRQPAPDPKVARPPVRVTAQMIAPERIFVVWQAPYNGAVDLDQLPAISPFSQGPYQIALFPEGY